MSLANTLRRWAGLALIFACGQAMAATPGVPAEVTTQLARHHVPLADVHVYIQDVNQSQPLLDFNGSAPVHPASVMKLVTTDAALELLGPAYTWKTRVYRTGQLEHGVLNGDLWFKGDGDPSLTLQNFWLIMQDLHQAGIQAIHGNVHVDESFYQLPPQAGAFDQDRYAPYNVQPQALMVNFQATSINLEPDAHTGRVALTSEPASSELVLDNHLQLAPAAACGYWQAGVHTQITPLGNGMRVSLSGRYPAACGKQSLHLRLFDPVDYFGQVFRELWQASGGELTGQVTAGQVPEGAQLIDVHTSKPLAQAIYDMNKYSNNVMARQIYLTLGATPAGASLTQSHARLENWLASQHLQFPELVVENGSGLSRTEQISVQHLAQLLVAAWHQPFMPELVDSLPVVGVDGTMKGRDRNQPVAGHAHIKTGTLDTAKSIAGYVHTASGHRLAVVFIANGPHASDARYAQDALLEWLYRNG